MRYRNLNPRQQGRVDAQMQSGQYGQGRLGQIARRRAGNQISTTPQPLAQPQPMAKPAPAPMPQPQMPMAKPASLGNPQMQAQEMAASQQRLMSQPTQEMYQQAGQQALNSFGTNQGMQPMQKPMPTLGNYGGAPDMPMTYGGQPAQQSANGGYTLPQQEQPMDQMQPMQQRMGIPRSY